MSELPKAQINKHGIVIWGFPILAIIVTKQPLAIRDLPQDFLKKADFEASRDKGHPASTSVAIGLLGVKIPLLHRKK